MGLFNFYKKKTWPFDNKYVFDKARYHDHSIEQLGLDEEQSFVHTGLFFAWLVINGLMSDFFIKEEETFQNDIEDLRERRISPSSIYMKWDGVLIGDLLSEKGFSFAMSYFDFKNGKYLTDYESVFNVRGDQIFTVKDTWENYDTIRPWIEAAYEKWDK